MDGQAGIYTRAGAAVGQSPPCPCGIQRVASAQLSQGTNYGRFTVQKQCSVAPLRQAKIPTDTDHSLLAVTLERIVTICRHI